MARRKRVNMKNKAASSSSSSTIHFQSVDFEDAFSVTEVADLNEFCTHQVTLQKEPEIDLQTSVDAELQLAFEYGIGTEEGVKDWLALTDAFGWKFIKLKMFEELESKLQEPSNMDSDTLLGLFISRLVNTLKENDNATNN